MVFAARPDRRRCYNPSFHMSWLIRQTPSSPFFQTTSALCKAANVTRGQLRLYEEEGLIAPQSRTEAGYRQYGSETLDRLRAILHLKELGLTLAEIALLLSDRDHGVLDECLDAPYVFGS